MFCAPGLFLGCTVGAGYNFHVLRSQNCFLRYRERQVQFSCFTLTDSFSAVSRVSVPVLMFCAPELVLGGSEDDRSSFNILHSRTRFGRYRGRRVPFSCFALTNSFWAVPYAPGLVFMFCAPGLVLAGTKGVRCSFHVLRLGLVFGGTEGAQVPFSCFAFPNSFMAISTASGLIFLFCAPKLILGGTTGARSCLHVMHCRTLSRW
jgi:hypothetical protein